MGLLFYLKLYALTIPIFFVIDIIWLGVIAKGFYRRQLGFILSPDVNWAAAIVFYLMYIVGILFFAVRPALNEGSWQQAIVLGGLYGFFTYATYDFTNLALIKGWPPIIVLVDILWGVCLCTIVSVSSFAIAKWLS
ncbi:hypothetical protein D1AOALGA4SA_9048 [Olavius algarvensis Delta 1 endosymbiont]|nr:hypothetical protein D1AOALGA4SA_9048 [Olavius algarvensis Delta 1 endosymbiont]